jgi:hypothetical protein
MKLAQAAASFALTGAGGSCRAVVVVVLVVLLKVSPSHRVVDVTMTECLLGAIGLLARSSWPLVRVTSHSFG